MKKIKSFTLAEVLITLVVIGIIAAITVPLVIANHKRTETATKLKKAYSTIVNAIKLAEIEHGIPLSSWNSPICSDKESCMYTFNTYLSKFFSYQKIITYFDETHDYLDKVNNTVIDQATFSVYLNDGTIINIGNAYSDS